MWKIHALWVIYTRIIQRRMWICWLLNLVKVLSFKNISSSKIWNEQCFRKIVWPAFLYSKSSHLTSFSRLQRIAYIAAIIWARNDAWLHTANVDQFIDGINYIVQNSLPRSQNCDLLLSSSSLPTTLTATRTASPSNHCIYHFEPFNNSWFWMLQLRWLGVVLKTYLGVWWRASWCGHLHLMAGLSDGVDLGHKFWHLLRVREPPLESWKGKVLGPMRAPRKANVLTT